MVMHVIIVDAYDMGVDVDVDMHPNTTFPSFVVYILYSIPSHPSTSIIPS